MSPGRWRALALWTAVLLLLGAGGVGGCASSSPQTRNGVYHKVGKGETLWRICYTYRVNMQTVCRVNRIQDPAYIVVGQRIFIPGAEAVRPVKLPPAEAASGGTVGREQETASSENKRKGESPQSKVIGSAPAQTGGAAWAGGLRFIWPVKGPVTSWFGPRDGRPHDGIDISVPKGTPVLAAEKGKVIYSDNGIKGYGNLIILQHAGGFHSVYGHNRRNRVEVDEQVNKGQVIAEVGNSGRASGFHLHFEIRRNERAVDPMDYLP